MRGYEERKILLGGEQRKFLIALEDIFLLVTCSNQATICRGLTVCRVQERIGDLVSVSGVFRE